jgi:hypothetical protein
MAPTVTFVPERPSYAEVTNPNEPHRMMRPHDDPNYQWQPQKSEPPVSTAWGARLPQTAASPHFPPLPAAKPQPKQHGIAPKHHVQASRVPPSMVSNSNPHHPREQPHNNRPELPLRDQSRSNRPELGLKGLDPKNVPLHRQCRNIFDNPMKAIDRSPAPNQVVVRVVSAELIKWMQSHKILEVEDLIKACESSLVLRQELSIDDFIKVYLKYDKSKESANERASSRNATQDKKGNKNEGSTPVKSPRASRSPNKRKEMKTDKKKRRPRRSPSPAKSSHMNSRTPRHTKDDKKKRRSPSPMSSRMKSRTPRRTKKHKKRRSLSSKSSSSSDSSRTYSLSSSSPDVPRRKQRAPTRSRSPRRRHPKANDSNEHTELEHIKKFIFCHKKSNDLTF